MTTNGGVLLKHILMGIEGSITHIRIVSISLSLGTLWNGLSFFPLALRPFLCRPCGDGEADAGVTRSADLADRSRQPLDGDQRARLRRGRLQCADRSRYGTSPDRHA